MPDKIISCGGYSKSNIWKGYKRYCAQKLAEAKAEVVEGGSVLECDEPADASKAQSINDSDEHQRNEEANMGEELEVDEQVAQKELTDASLRQIPWTRSSRSKKW